MNAPRLENDSMKIIDIVDAYRAGRIAIPEFQRDYVWQKNRAPKLMDSLYRKFPVSALLFWQSEDRGVTRRPSPKAAKGSMSWLIDGQQRVMTLSRVMNGDEGLEVVFNPELEHFSLVNAATRKDPSWIPIAMLFDDDDWREFRRELPTGPKGKKLEAVYERVRDIRNYEIPVVQMVNHTFDEAVNAFTRINSLGVRLKAQDIASARVAARHTGLIANHVAPFMEQIAATGLKRLNVMHLFRVCAYIASPDARMRTPLHELSQAEVMAAWKKTEKATMAAYAIIKSELGLSNMDILWSGALMVPIIVMMAESKPGKADPKGMMGWLALAALSHRYSGSTETTLDKDLKACRASDPVGALLSNLRQRQGANGLLSRPQDFSGSLNDRSGLLATYIACRNRGVKDIFTSQTINLQEGIDRHHILPRRQFPEASRSSADVVANIAFITSEVNKSISHSGPEVYLKDIKEPLLASQCIPSDPNLWSVKDAGKFFAARRELLSESFNYFVCDALPNRKL